MRLGNILGFIGITIGFIGFMCLPLWNLYEHRYLADTGFPKGGGWILFAQTGLFMRPGFYMIIIGVLLFLIAKRLPKRYWYTSKDLAKDEMRKGMKKKS